MELPFLKDSKWPISKEPGEKIVNPSYDTQVEEHLMDELMQAIETKNPSKLRESLVALIDHLKASEE